MRKNNTPSKWLNIKEKYLEWWGSLTSNEKVLAKKKFVAQSIANKNLKTPFPDMPDIEHIRLCKLTNSHLYRIWCFRDRDEKLF